MVSKISKLFLLALFFTNYLFAQELFVCESYSEDGKPIGVLNRVEIKPYGTALYVLLNNKKAFNDPILYLFVDKFMDGKFKPFDSKTLSVKKNDTWTVTNYEFKEKGVYEVYFLNSSQNKIASGKIEVVLSEKSISQHSKDLTSFYSGCQFTFCELVVNGKPVNPFSKLSFSKSDGNLFIYLNNHVPFGVGKLKVQIWKVSNNDKNYEQLIETKKYKLLPQWKDTFFKYKFNQTGEFKIEVVDSLNNFISSNIITVTN